MKTPVGIHAVTGALDGAISGRDGQLDEAPHFLDLFFFDVPGRIEVLDLPGDTGAEARSIEGRDGAHAAVAGLQGFPHHIRTDTHGGQQAHSGHYDSALQACDTSKNVAHNWSGARSHSSTLPNVRWLGKHLLPFGCRATEHRRRPAGPD